MITVVLEKGGGVMNDRCLGCKLYCVETTDVCPICKNIIDLEINGLTLSWKCRKCDYEVATTVYKLCVVDNGKYSKEQYGKRKICPYVALDNKWR